MTTFTNKQNSGVQIELVAENGDTYLVGESEDLTLVTQDITTLTNKSKNSTTLTNKSKS